jgi:hypothetical protein
MSRNGPVTLKPQDAPRRPAWERVKLARHPQRPFTLDFLKLAFSDFLELHGDRLFGDDAAIVGGMAVLLRPLHSRASRAQDGSLEFSGRRTRLTGARRIPLPVG